MSTSTAMSSAAPSADPASYLPPPGLNFIASIQIEVLPLMVTTVLGALLIPLAIAMLVFSTAESRKKPVFLLNLLAICFGIVLSVFSGYQEIHGMLNPLDGPQVHVMWAYSVLINSVPFIVECILLIRVYAVFPYRLTPRLQYCAIWAFTICAKVVRLLCIGLYWHHWATEITSGTNPLSASQVIFYQTPYVKIVWLVEFFDNAYISLLFLYQIWRRKGHQFSGGVYRPRSLQARIQGLFYIALSSYIFPALCSIVEITFVFMPDMFMPCIIAEAVDVYASIAGVVFATVWTTGITWSGRLDETVTVPSKSSRKPSYSRTESSGRTTGAVGIQSSAEPMEITASDSGSLGQKETFSMADEYPLRVLVQTAQERSEGSFTGMG